MDKKTAIAIIVVVIVVVAAAAAVIVTRSDNESKRDIDTSDYGRTVGTELSESQLPGTASRLWVYGNANEDDYLNTDDVTYLKGIIDGENKATVLADANCDGTVDEDDIDYLEQILAANEKTEITVYYIDNYWWVSQVHWPVQTIAIGFSSGGYCADLCGLIDKVAMVDDTIATTDWKHINSKFSTLPSFGWEETPDREAVLNANIDVFVPGYCNTGVDPETRTFFNGTSTDYMFMNTCDKDGGGDNTAKEDIDRSIVMEGFLLQGDMDRVYEYLAWHDSIISQIKSAVSSLTDSERVSYIMFRTSPSYITSGSYTIAGKGNTCTYHSNIAGADAAGIDKELSEVYNYLDADAILALIQKYANDGTFYVIDNENDGLRHQRELSVTAAAIADMLSSSSVDIKYFGMARETCNSPLYVAETAFYLDVFYPDRASGISYESILDYYFDHFVTEDLSSYFDMDHFFVSFDNL